MTTLKIKITACGDGDIHFRLDKEEWNAPPLPQMEFKMSFDEVKSLSKALQSFNDIGCVKAIGLKFDISSADHCPEEKENFLPKSDNVFTLKKK